MKNFSLSCFGVLFLVAFTLTVNSSFAQFALSPAAVANTDISTYNDTVSVTNLINQSGVQTPFVSGVTVFDTYFANPGQVFATSGNGGVNNWQSQVSFTFGHQGHVDFDLGAVYQINKLAIWNRSLSNITAKVLFDLNSPEQDAGTFTLINRQSFTFSYAVDVLPFNASYEGRYVRLIVNGIYPIQGFNFGYVNVGEVVASVLPVVKPVPTLSATLNPNGDVVITFTGTLQTSTAINGDFANVPGNPSSPYTLPKSGLPPAQFFRTLGN